jgi:spore coat polysaccharide biosynthesis protein SpsF (cytidylyltransferase family)
MTSKLELLKKCKEIANREYPDFARQIINHLENNPEVEKLVENG